MSVTAGSRTITPELGAVLLQDAALLESGRFARSGDDLVIIAADGTRVVVAGFFGLDPLPALTAGGRVVPGEFVRFAALDGGSVMPDGAGAGEQLARAPDDPALRPRASTKAAPFASEASMSVFRRALSSGEDMGTALDKLIESEKVAATKRGVPAQAFENAVKMFTNELFANLNSKMGIEAAVADAERIFKGATGKFTAPAKAADPVLEALASGKGIDKAVAAGQGRNFERSLGESLARGEDTAQAIDKAKTLATASVKATAAGDPILAALARGESVDKVVGQVKGADGGTFEQRLAEALGGGASIAEALGTAKAAAETATAAKAAEVDKGMMAALASGAGVDKGTVGGSFDRALGEALASGASADLALQIARTSQAKAEAAAAKVEAQKGGLMEALASGEPGAVAAASGSGGKSFEAALGEMLASGASVDKAMAQAQTAAEAQGKVAAAGGDSVLAALAGGGSVAPAAGGDAKTFERALGEALASGAAPDKAVSQATSRAQTAAAAIASVGTTVSTSSSSGAGASTTATASTAATTTATTTTATTAVTATTTTTATATPQPAVPPLASSPPPPAVAFAPPPVAYVPPPPPPPSATVNNARNDPPPRPPPPPPPNLAPVIGAVGPRSVAEDGMLTIALTLSDDRTPAGGLQVNAVAANAALLPTGGISYVNGALSLAPAANQWGATSVTVTVSDGQGGITRQAFDLSVAARGDAPGVTAAAATEGQLNAAGLVVTPNAADGAEITHFRITDITDGALYLADGSTQVAEGGFITRAQGLAGLKYRPGSASDGTDNFQVQAATGPGLADATGPLTTATITVTTINDAPVVSAGAIATPTYSEQLAAQAFMPALAFTDVDNATLSWATLAISSGYTAGDVLNFAAQNAITGSWNAGTLTLSGTASHSAYKTAIESVTFSSSSDHPTAVSSSRTISLTVNDGGAASNAVTAPVNVVGVNDAPVIAGASVEGATPSRGLVLDGNGDYVNLGTPAELATGSGDYTMEAWIKTSRSGARQEIIKFGGSEAATNQAAFLYVDTNGFLRSDVSNVYGPVSAATVNDGNWHHVAAVYDGSALQLYIDGAASGARTAVSPNIQAGAAMVGASTALGSYFTGQVFDVRIWGTARPAADIATFRTMDLTGSEPGLIGNWRLDDGTGTSLANEVTGGAAGTLAGNPAWATAAAPTFAANVTVAANTDYRGVLSATDAEGQAVTYAAAAGGAPTKGTLTVNADGSFRYAPNANATGADSFTVQATDASGASFTRAISVTISDPPVVLGARDGRGLVRFDGNDYLTAAMGTGTVTNVFTLETAVNYVANGAQQNILRLADSSASGNTRFVPYITTAGRLAIYLGNDGGNTSLDTGHALAGGAWHNIAVTYDGITVRAYVNGDQVYSGQTSYALGNSPQTLTIGSDNGGGFGATAMMDEVRVWNVARSAADIKADHDRVLSGQEPGLQGYWRFDGLTASATDLTGNGHTAVFAGCADAPFGPAALLLDGASYVATAAAASTQVDNVTIEAWARLDGTDGAGQVIAYNGRTDTEGYGIYLDATGHPNVLAGGIALLPASGVTIATGGWHHYAAVRENGVWKLYIDGQSAALAGTAATPNAISTGVTSFGGHPLNVGESFIGALADVRLWNVARSAADIQGAMHHRLAGNEAGLAGYWRLDDASGATAANAVTGGVAGTRSGNATFASGANAPAALDIPDRALDLDGTSGYVAIQTAGYNNLAQGTIEAWVNLDSLTEETIIAKQHDGVGSAGLLTIGHHMTDQQGIVAGTAGKIYFRGSNSNVGSTELVSTTTLQAGRWHHLAVTFDATQATLYVDGIRDATASGNFSLPDDTAAQTLTSLGAWLGDGGGRYLDGRIADVRIWNTARSAQDVAGAMNMRLTGAEEGLVGYYRLDEGTGTSVANTVADGGAATLVNGTAWAETGAGIYDTAIATNANTPLRGTSAVGTLGAAVTAVAVADPAHGTLALDAATGNYTYMPSANYIGTDTFTVSATADGITSSRAVTVTVNDPVSAAAAGSQARNNTYATLAGGASLRSAGTVSYATATYEAWIKTTTAGDWIGLITTPSDDTQSFLQLALNSSGKLRFEAFKDANNKVEYDATTTVVTDGQWHHVAATFDGATGTTQLYVDGNPEALNTIASQGGLTGLSVANQPLLLGINRAESGAYTGAIDEVRVWNTARSGTEIKATMNRTPEGDEPGLLRYFDFEEGTGTLARDKNAADTLSLQGAGTLSWIKATGQGGGVRLDAADGSNDYISLANTAHTLDVGAAGSIEMWVRRDEWNTTTDQALMSSGLSHSNANALYLTAHQDVGLHLRYGNGATDYLNFQGSDNWAAGSWHHVAATWDSGSYKLYADGQLADSGAGPTVLNATPEWSLGKQIAGDNQVWTNGMQVDDLRIWSTARSAAEIAFDMDNAAIGNEAGLQGYWKMDEGAGTTLADATGHGNTGALVNGTWTTDGMIDTPPALMDRNFALKLDGVDDVATVSGINFANQAFSWEFWAYRTNASGNDFILSQGPAASMQGLHIGYSNNTFQFNTFGSDLVYTDSDSNTNEWVHWAGTYDAGTNLQVLYKNGEETTRVTASADYQGTGAFYIGNTTWPGNNFHGSLDEVRLWSDVRTAAEVKANYAKRLVGNEDHLTALWHFDEGLGTTAADATLANLDLTLANGAGWEDLMSQTVGNAATRQFHTLGSETDAGSLAFTLIGANGGAALGTASIDSQTGVLNYTAGSTDGADSVSYQITDEHGATSVGVVNVAVV